MIADVPVEIANLLKKEGIKTLRPVQELSIKAGLLEGCNQLVCTPTASGKTLVAEIAILNHIISGKGKAVYIVPLKALASEKYREFKERYGDRMKIALSIGDLDSAESHLANYDLILCTSEKLDSLMRHNIPWLQSVSLLIIDEIHILNEPSRGPTLEIIITILRKMLKDIQIIGLSATIGNPDELAQWLGARLIIDDWRPIDLDKGIYLDGKVEFY